MNYEIKELNLSKDDKLLLILPEKINGCIVSENTKEKIYNQFKYAIDKNNDKKVIEIPESVQIFKVSYDK